MKFTCLTIAALFLLAPLASHAGDAAFLFTYVPKSGQQKQFDAGYRQHLEWHRQQEDPLPWYGWYVDTGERTGMFVDGSFGITFAAFDERVEPAADAADFRSTTAPHADTAYRKVLRLMPRLGTATRLEDREPSAAVDVVTYSLYPGKAAAFERCLTRLVAALKDVPRRIEFTTYHELSGGAQPSYLLMFPRDGYAGFEADAASLEALIDRHADAQAARELRTLLHESVRSAYSEAWRYRQDLSYFPAE